MKFSIWSYDGGQIDLMDLYGFKMGFELLDYVKSNEWDVMSFGVDRNVIIYVCCLDVLYVDIMFNIMIIFVFWILNVFLFKNYFLSQIC